MNYERISVESIQDFPTEDSWLISNALTGSLIRKYVTLFPSSTPGHRVVGLGDFSCSIFKDYSANYAEGECPDFIVRLHVNADGSVSPAIGGFSLRLDYSSSSGGDLSVSDNIVPPTAWNAEAGAWDVVSSVKAVKTSVEMTHLVCGRILIDIHSIYDAAHGVIISMSHLRFPDLLPTYAWGPLDGTPYYFDIQVQPRCIKYVPNTINTVVVKDYDETVLETLTTGCIKFKEGYNFGIEG